MPELAQWSTFASTLVSASATLVGLVFIAVSINLSRILSGTHLPARAVEALLQFFQVLVIAMVLLIPGVWPSVVALTAVLVGGTSCSLQMRSWRKTLHNRDRFGGTRAVVMRGILVQASTLPLCVAGILLLLGNSHGLYWLVPGFLASFAAGLTGAWVLLVEIVR